MTDLPLISIVTPSYHQAQFLEQTIQSVLSQDYPHLEYLILDGGSTDASVDIIRRYADRLAYWVSEPDRGQSHAINKGFALARGSVLGWLNSDDTFLPGALDTVGTAFRQHPEVDLIYGNFVYTDMEGRPMRHRKVFSHISFDQLVFHDYLGQPAVFFRRRLLEQVGPLDESLHYCMDWDLFLRMWQVSRPLHVPRELATYRLNHSAKSNAEDSEKVQHIALSVQRRYVRRPFSKDWQNSCWLQLQFINSLGWRTWSVLRDNPVDYARTLWRMFPNQRFFRLWQTRLRSPGYDG